MEPSKVTDENVIAQLDEALAQSSAPAANTISGKYGEILTINNTLIGNPPSVSSLPYSDTVSTGSGLRFVRMDAFSVHTYHYRIKFSANTKVNVDIYMREPDGEWYHPDVIGNTASTKFDRSSIHDYIYFEVY